MPNMNSKSHVHREGVTIWKALGLMPVLVFLIVVLGCGKRTMVVLLPDPDGTTGQVIVSNPVGSVTMNSPNQATSTASARTAPKSPVVMEEEAIQSIFSGALEIQPKPPLHFLLYFREETTLTSASSGLIPEILQAIQERDSTDISVVGHTDTTGNKEYNMDLSRRRAAAVQSLLLENGVQPDHVKTTSHGEENPLVKTGDNVSEPKNRRVEVVVR